MSAGVTLRFGRLADHTIELIALHSHEGRSVAAVIHPHHRYHDDDPPIFARRWSLAGDLRDPAQRARGEARSTEDACAEATEALGRELGVAMDGYEINE